MKLEGIREELVVEFSRACSEYVCCGSNNKKSPKEILEPLFLLLDKAYQAGTKTVDSEESKIPEEVKKLADDLTENAERTVNGGF